mmetsp:Transcript_1910/g.5062  ORF Transcript_1910/g.5062 Transcript_1910/m.5062 type:complete len:502 (-) Transcript_1910:548-2053(-)
MRNGLSLFERGEWDPHPELNKPYVFAGARGVPTQDMNAPLSHYFVSSGHNSYLSRDQLMGKSTTATIIMCLGLGCRVIELDVYNGPSEAVGPVCKHGGTATRAISLRACVQAIREHSFKASPYPVTITIENHTDEENQGFMAKILKDVLGDKLFVPSEGQPGAEWLSPEALKGKVLIRANAGKLTNASMKSLVYIANTKFLGFAHMNALPGVTSSSIVESKVEKIMKPLGEHQQKQISSMRQDAALETADVKLDEAAAKAKAKQAGAEELEGEDDEMDEGAVDAETITQKTISQYARRHLLRVYPAGWRIASGNYDPSQAWALGTSFAALNWQTWDKPLWINQAKFRDNGGCGYVRKPDWMIEGEDLPSRRPRKLRVHIFSAHKSQDMSCFCMKDDLMVGLEVRGMAVDSNKRTTNAVQDSGRLTVDQTYEFEVHYPEMAQLLLLLLDEDIDAHDVLGYFSVSLATIQPGRYKLEMFDPSKPGGTPFLKHAWIKAEFSWAD